MVAFNMRTSKPAKGNKYFNNGSNGGWSWCIEGYPRDSGCNVLANCVGYACGRFNEIIGSMKYPQLCCNAENFVERAKQYGLQVVSYPTLGGIMVWQAGSTGHVAIVERIDSANQIYTSESGYGGSAFWNATRTNSNGRWGCGSGYTFRGCIINPAIGDVHWVDPSPSGVTVTYQTWDDVLNCWLPNVMNDSDYAGIFGHDVCGVFAHLNGGNTYYKVHVKGGSWLPEVKNRNDFAGLYNMPIDGFMIKGDKRLKYRVHLRRTKEWLPWVTGYDTKDLNNGFAGMYGYEIDAIQIKPY